MSRGGGDLRYWARNLEREAEAARGLYDQVVRIVDDGDFFQRLAAECRRRVLAIRRERHLLAIRYAIAISAVLLWLVGNYAAGRGWL